MDAGVCVGECGSGWRKSVCRDVNVKLRSVGRVKSGAFWEKS